MHAARKLGRELVRDMGAKPHPAQLFDGEFARFGLGALQRAAHQAEGHVFPDAEAVEQRATLKQHPEPRQKGVAVARGHILPVQRDAALIRGDKAQDAFQQHRFAGARPPDDHHRGALGDGQIDPAQHLVRPEGLMHAAELNHEKNSSVSR